METEPALSTKRFSVIDKRHSKPRKNRFNLLATPEQCNCFEKRISINTESLDF